jgi:AAA+ ATPase superfamily predicted ATPase
MCFLTPAKRKIPTNLFARIKKRILAKRKIPVILFARIRFLILAKRKIEMFAGRKPELARLQQYKNKPTGSLIVMRGRRRIGKSRLIAEFAKNMNFVKISGLPPTPDSPNAQVQRQHFAEELTRLGLAKVDESNWYNLFLQLAQNLPKGQTVLLLDEISWMADGDATFLPKLKDIWDEHFKKQSKLIVVLCGSVSSWIDKNILSSTAFFGRINEKITLGELSIAESLDLLKAQGFKGSTLEKFMVLAVTGGVPWYLEQFTKGNTAEGHLRRLCFQPEALFVDEFKRIFHDLFTNRAETYMRIVAELAGGPKEYKTISEHLNYGSSGTLSDYLNDLETAGFIKKDSSWSLKTGLEKKVFVYRLSDNYLRFYLRCIQPHLKRIAAGHFAETAVTSLKGFASVMGLQLENLVLSNRPLIFEALGINRQTILADSPYLQRAGKTQAGCQIDYMIQTELNSLFICEIKFSKNTISSKVIQELQDKIKALKKPKHLACLPVVIYFGEASEAVLDSSTLFKAIDFQEFFR